MTRPTFAAAALALSLAAGASLAVAQPPNADAGACTATFRIYFQAEESRLNRFADAVIAAAVADLDGCAAPIVAFAASREADGALNANRQAAILSAVHSRGIDATPVEVARASLISSAPEDTPAYLQLSLAPSEREAVAALKEALPQQRTRPDPIPTS